MNDCLSFMATGIVALAVVFTTVWFVARLFSYDDDFDNYLKELRDYYDKGGKPKS